MGAIKATQQESEDESIHKENGYTKMKGKDTLVEQEAMIESSNIKNTMHGRHRPILWQYMILRGAPLENCRYNVHSSGD